MKSMTKIILLAEVKLAIEINYIFSLFKIFPLKVFIFIDNLCFNYKTDFLQLFHKIRRIIIHNFSQI